MTTHSFTVERLEGPYLTRVVEYEAGDETLMATCRNVVRTFCTLCGVCCSEQLSGPTLCEILVNKAEQRHGAPFLVSARLKSSMFFMYGNSFEEAGGMLLTSCPYRGLMAEM